MQLGKYHKPKTLEKMRAAQTRRRTLAGPHSATLQEFDMVVCPDGTVGLLTTLMLTGPSAVRLAVNAWQRHDWRALRRATLKEIADAGLEGADCNQVRDST